MLKEKASKYPQGSGVNARIVKNSYDFLLDAREKGAEFVLGKPEYLSGTNTALHVALLTGVTKDMKLWDEESFGPSATVIIVNDDAQLIDVANQTGYGLDTLLFTQNMKRALDIARQLDVGRVRVNNPGHERKC